LVQRLVINGFIYKSQAIDDNRKSVLHLTAKGRELLPYIKEKENLFNEHNIASLSDIIDLKTFISVLKFQIKGTESEQKIKKRLNID
jgi:DNA-binding MarR family transcriptional regulator